MLIVRHIRHWYEPKLPHAVFLNDYFVGMMKDNDACIEVPSGTYSLRVQFGGPLRLGKAARASTCRSLPQRKWKCRKTRWSYVSFTTVRDFGTSCSTSTWCFGLSLCSFQCTYSTRFFPISFSRFGWCGWSLSGSDITK